ncbi:MAG: hypothetical protein KF906_06715 [Actinobacteria bacterium]|nr:hypothetical protein [Actinomycetota bacterium]
MKLSRTITPLILGAVLMLSVAGCTGDDRSDADGTTAAKSTEAEGCSLLSSGEIAKVLGKSYTSDPDASSKAGCLLRSEDGTGFVSYSTSDVADEFSFEGLVEGDDAIEVDGVGDQALLWFDGDPLVATLVTRRGGAAVTVRLSGVGPTSASATTSTQVDGATATTGTSTTTTGVEGVDDALRSELRKRIVALANVAVVRLDDRPFSAEAVDTAAAAAACGAADTDVVAKVLEVPASSVTIRTLGASSCEVGTEEGTNAIIELVSGAGTKADLAGLGRSSEVDGTTYAWEPKPVEGVGDAAVWLLDPVSKATGELYALWGNGVVHISMTAPTPDVDLRGYAVALALAVGPGLTN